jgi:pyrimidine operon attenuation protein/uracil phosphoribosyltransferase
MTHEIIEKNTNLESIVLLGILKKGYPLAKILQKNLKDFSGITVETHAIDIKAYRDDLDTNIDKVNQGFNLDKKTVIIVDDVLFTGRTVRAAMDAINNHGRPEKIELAILIDRGHRELPIRADFIGKNIPTSSKEKVVVDLEKQLVTIDD